MSGSESGSGSALGLGLIMAVWKTQPRCNANHGLRPLARPLPVLQKNEELLESE